MKIDIHSHAVPANYLEAIKREPKSVGSRLEKNARGREMIVMDNGRSTQFVRRWCNLSCACMK